MAKFEMDTEFIRKLAAVLEETHLGEIELADGERRIRIARPTVTMAAAAGIPASYAPAPIAPTPAAAGQTLLIIEAMKTFNPIKAPKTGTVVQVLIENAQPVEFGEPLMIVE